MKFSFLFVYLIIGSLANCQSIQEIRSGFHQAVMSPEKSKDFHSSIKELDEVSSTIIAYQAVSEALLAQIVWNPFSKLSQVMKYDRMMKKAVLEDKDNIEIRFLRLAIEVNLPSFLGLSTHVQEDKNMIVKNMIVKNMSKVSSLKLEKKFGQYIFYFLSETGLCSQTEIRLMEEMLAANGI